ncbi:MAG: hypothetical protein DMG58_21250 [Acidobacteria bacterium]|nr:MAG: hypothetical protein DMG58_21250 [Acidobacteriota bacterium]
MRFRYRMIGLEEDWIQTAEHAVRYPALPPGDYRFEVLARSAEGVWSAAPAAVSFRILPSWWATWWSRTLGTMLLLLITVWRAQCTGFSKPSGCSRVPSTRGRASCTLNKPKCSRKRPALKKPTV